MSFCLFPVKDSTEEEIARTSEHILSTLHEMQQAGRLCDATLVASDGEVFVAHTGILAAASSPLRQELEECERGNYMIETSFSGREINALIHYAYTGDKTDPLLSSFTDMGLLCDIFDLPHAETILSFLHHFSTRGLFCNTACHGTQGVQPVHSYILAAKCPDISQHITYQGTINIHFGRPDSDSFPNDYEVNSTSGEQSSIQQAQYVLPSGNPVQGNTNLQLTNAVFVEHQSHQSNQDGHHCNICGKWFLDKVSCIEHILNHVNKDTYECDIPEKYLAAQRFLISQQRPRANAKTYKCDLCDQVLTTKKEHKQHQRSNHPSQYVCDICEKTYSSSYDLKKHGIVHTDKRPFVCEICNKGFRQKAALTGHYNVHREDVGEICPTCGKAFKSTKSLNRHMVIHTGRKPYGCDFCDKRFNQKPNLKTHQLVHTREKSHVCEVCGKSYGYKSMLKKHLLTAHDTDIA